MFSVEMVINVEDGSVVGTVKRLGLPSRSEEEEEQIDASFVNFFEEVLEEL